MLEKAVNYMASITQGLTSQQLAYFSWLVTGFTDMEVLDRLGIPEESLTEWREEIEGFTTIEQAVMTTHRDEFVKEMDRIARLRLHRKMQEVDSLVLDQAIDFGVDNLSDEQMKYLQVVRRKHDPEIARILGEEQKTELGEWSELVVKFKRGNNAPEITRHEEQEEDISDEQAGIIEGEYKESTDE